MAIYERLMDRMVEDLILSEPGSVPEPEEETALMKRYRVNRATIQRAIFGLTKQGVVVGAPGSRRYTQDPVQLRIAKERLIRQEAEALFHHARALGLDDHRTIYLLLKIGGYQDAQG